MFFQQTAHKLAEKKKESNQTLLTITLPTGEEKESNERKNELGKKKRGFAYSAVIAAKESKAPGGSSTRPLLERDLQGSNE